MQCLHHSCIEAVSKALIVPSHLCLPGCRFMPNLLHNFFYRNRWQLDWEQ
jgi:hypothetical protein